MNVAVVRFPGSNCDLDVVAALRATKGLRAKLVWHENDDLGAFDAVVLPGGFSFGDYLRAGAIAARSPSIARVRRLAEKGVPVLGICNGFQILVEAGLLPGSLLRNSGLKFVCKWVTLRVESNRTPFTRGSKRGEFLRLPIAHNEGRLFLPEDELAALKRVGRIVFRYIDDTGEPSARGNPNGSQENIAGICNEDGNVLGMMPHPERASDAILNPEGRSDGMAIFSSLAGLDRSGN
ncbi:MAG: phosphoribosylformylglycinamidine synthase I [Nitrososphaerales archaeon]